MPASYQNIQKRLQAFDFTGLFTQELMWNHYVTRDLVLPIDGVSYTLKPVAQRGMAVFECAPPTDAQFPNSATRRKIDIQVSKTAREHIIIFCDNAKTVQWWQWVKREAGKPSATRMQSFYIGQSGDALSQKIQGIAFELEDEPNVAEALARVGAAFDVEKVTKKFYEQFKKEHDAFLKFTRGIPDEKLQRWYASVMLNRLMFIYFIQKKGFLGGDQHYLTNKLTESQLRRKDKFYSDFLCPLFFEGFAEREELRSAETNRLLGRVPYLNGGLFLKHQIEVKSEQDGEPIEVPDKAFERIFTFFEQYDWHLDDRPTRTGREINPDVLGYVFEKYINQKEMGAYYTKEDITGYISQDTIIPALFDMARKSCRIAFEGAHSVWRLLEADPDRYIYAAVEHGIGDDPPAVAAVYDRRAAAVYDRRTAPRDRQPLAQTAVTDRRPEPGTAATDRPPEPGTAVTDRPPEPGTAATDRPPEPGTAVTDRPPEPGTAVTDRPPEPGTAVTDRRYKELQPEIAEGINDISKRTLWNRPAPPEYALPTETWREVVARRTRCEEVRNKLAAGEIRSINDLIIYNLDIRRFAEEVIANCEGPELLRAFYKAIRTISVLDPACGSGAFLFAALNILEQIYDRCLVRMQEFVDDLDRSAEKHSPEKYSDFRKTLEEMNDKSRHPSPRYFILKSIILNNLYGVDIMEEATEICKLRLFLKLVAQADAGDRIEPLPDIDFNIRPGNTLVGFTTEAELHHAIGDRLNFEDAIGPIKERAEHAETAYRRFREMQVQHGMESSEFLTSKAEVRQRLDSLRRELDRYLCNEYRVRADDKGAFESWRKIHQPFHWFVEFFHILKHGGFDAVIGNPPYVVYPNRSVPYAVLESRFRTFASKNLYAYVFEQSLQLARNSASVGLIVQLTALSSERVESLQDLLERRGQIHAVPFPRRPESVFADVEMPVVILISTANDAPPRFVTSNVNRFYSEERPRVSECLHFVSHGIRKNRCRIAKAGSALEIGLYEKTVGRDSVALGTYSCAKSKSLMYYQEACRYWVKALYGVPFFKRNGKRMEPPHGRTICFVSDAAASFATCLLNSSLFYWSYSALCDCEHINDSFVRQFPVPAGWERVNWLRLVGKLMSSLTENATRKTISTKQGHKIEYDEIKAIRSKAVIDEIDAALAVVYGLDEAELDYVTNYDIKYRAASDTTSESDDATAAATN